MKKKIAILGSTGSIGESLLKIIEKDIENFDIILLSANKNYNKLLKQAKKFKVKNLIIIDFNAFKKAKLIYKKKDIQIYNNFNNFNNIFKIRADYIMSSIVGLDGLQPTLDIIKHTKTIAIANKETIICGWNLIKKKLTKYKVNFIPVDSEHFSIWSSINSKKLNIEKIFLTASGGPFYKNKFSELNNIKLHQALKHPTWKMGKKISIDSATLANKIFELIEAKKIFNLELRKIKIITHPSSYVHAIIKFNNGLIKLIAHETSMIVPIFNSLYWNADKSIKTKSINFRKLNNLNFMYSKNTNFPLLNLIKKIPNKDSLFETVIVSANDYLVSLFLNKKIRFTTIVKVLLKISNMKHFKLFKNQKPINVSQILKAKEYTINSIDKLNLY